jgi:hypothetical protein
MTTFCASPTSTATRALTTHSARSSRGTSRRRQFDLRDWIKGQITAVESGILSFEAVCSRLIQRRTAAA